MNRDVQRSAICVRKDGALIGGDCSVPVAQQQDFDTARLQFSTQTPAESQRDVFLRERITERSAAFVSPMTGIDHHEESPLRQARRWRQDWRDARSNGR